MTIVSDSGNGGAKSSPDSGFPPGDDPTGHHPTAPDGSKFYENLPFHGMQQQGNGPKQVNLYKQFTFCLLSFAL